MAKEFVVDGVPATSDELLFAACMNWICSTPHDVSVRLLRAGHFDPSDSNVVWVISQAHDFAARDRMLALVAEKWKAPPGNPG